VAAKVSTPWVHAVRALAVTLVVLLHAAAQPFYRGARVDTYDWWVAIIYDSATRICVPLFFMLTGHLLLGSTDGASTFYRKRARRILVPWITWSLAYLFLVVFYEVHHPSGASAMTADVLNEMSEAGPGALLGIAVSPSKAAPWGRGLYYHLWFLYALVWMYALLPLWRRVLASLTPARKWGVVGLWFLVAGALAFAPGPGPLPLAIFAVLFYNLTALLGFPLLGYLLGRVTLSRRLFWTMSGVAIVGTLATIFGTAFLTRRDGGALNVTLWGDSLNVVATAAAAFTIVRYVVERRLTGTGLRLPRLVLALSETSFGVYLLHPMLLYALAVGVFGIKATALSFDGLLAIPVLAIVTLATSHLVVRGLQRVPYLRAIVG
jgi:surface polysaccharide O-acyltransferase-like enzyme